MPTPEKIYISKNKEIQNLYIRLSKDFSKEGISKPFRTMRDVFLAAAITGFVNNESKKLNTSKDLFVWGTLLNEPHALTTLRAIALCKTKDPDTLLDDSKIAKIAEEYANAGIHILAKKVLDTDANELEETAMYMLEVLKDVKTDEDV